MHFILRNSLLLHRPYKSKSFCVVSDDKKHDATAAHAFTEHLIQEIRGVVPEVTKLIYFTDGGPGHFKNRFNFANMSMFFQDHDSLPEWHTFADGHGKNGGDGIGAAAMKQVTRACLQGYRIKTTFEFFQYANEHIKVIKFIYVSIEVIEISEEKLAERAELAVQVKDTQKMHCFIPL